MSAPPGLLAFAADFDQLVASGWQHPARVAGLLFGGLHFGGGCDAHRYVGAGSWRVLASRPSGLPYEVISLFNVTRERAAALDLPSLVALLRELQTPEWAVLKGEAEGVPAAFAHALTFAALPEAFRGILTEAMRIATGRRVTFHEPCRIWEASETLYGDIAQRGAAEAPSGSEGGGGGSAAASGCGGAKLGLPSGAEFGALVEADAAMINNCWKYGKTEVSLRRLKNDILHSLTGCIRVSAAAGAGGGAASVTVPKEGGAAAASAPAAPVLDAASAPVASTLDSAAALASWVLLRGDGSIGVLNTLAEHRSRGFGAAVVKGLIARLKQWQTAAASGAAEIAALSVLSGPTLAAALGAIRPHCHIKVGNVESESLFTRLGFTVQESASWLFFNAPAPRFRLRPINPEAEHEWSALFALTNASYRQDDAFFVDQQRTDMANLRTMARDGVFFVGYRLKEGSVGAPGSVESVGATTTAVPEGSVLRYCRQTEGGLSSEAFPLPVASSSPTSSADVIAASAAPDDETGELICSAYLSIAHPSSSSSTREDVNAPKVVALPSAPPPAEGGGRPDAHFGMLVVAPEVKHMGVALRVLRFLEATARETHACASLQCFVVSVKPWLRSFYLAQGFLDVGRAEWPPENEHQLKMPCFFHSLAKVL